MLAISPLRLGNNDMESFSLGGAIGCDDDFPDFSSGNLLDSIDFDDLFIGIEGGDMLPDLEMDPELLAEFTLSGSSTTTTTTGGGEEYSDVNTSAVVSVGKMEDYSMRKEEEDEEDKVSRSGSGSGSGSGSIGSSSMRGEEIVSKREVSETTAKTLTKDGEKGRKSTASTTHAKNSHGKRKVKVDWTPELHRRFVQAVEQLGVDKAVPSRILEIMGIDCLTRHNIASHLQKYRSHRKHLLAREAEAASWSQRRQMYSGGPGGGGGHVKREIMNPWVAPTMGFPPITQAPPPPPPPMHHHFRPLHVWGHPSVDQSLMHMWPKHLAHSPSPPPHQHHPPHTTWAPPPPPLADPSYWHHPHHQRVPNGLTPGTPCFPPPLATTRFPTPPVPGIPPPRPPHHAMYKTDLGIGVSTRQSSASHPPFDFHPSTESVDAAIGDVLSKPWLPLPLGLKPPSLDGVMVELQRQGVPKIPPSCSS